MLRNYEFTVIFRSDLGDDNLTAALRDYESIITANDGGTVLKKDEWGTKRFAYPIKKHFRGYYVCYAISTTAKVIKDIEQHIRYDGNVLRYILIAVKGDVDVPDNATMSEATDSAASSTTQDSRNTPEANESKENTATPDASAAKASANSPDTNTTEQPEQQEQDK